MSPEEKDKNVLKYWPSKYPGMASEKQVVFLNSLLKQGHLFESDFDAYEYADASVLPSCRASKLITLGLYRQLQAKVKREEEIQNMGDSNSKIADRKLIEGQKIFITALETVTSLKRYEILSLAKNYGLDDFLGECSSQIIEKEWGTRIVELVFSILMYKKYHAEFNGGISKSADDNPKLTKELRNWIMNDAQKMLDEGRHNTTYPRPEPPEGIEQDEQEVDEFSDMEVENE